MTSDTRNGLIYLRLSDFRDEDDDGTFIAREDELRALASEHHLTDAVTVETENDVPAGKRRSASAYKTPLKVTTANGVITRRTSRPAFTRVLLALQEHRAGILIAGDESRISREWRDALDLLDVVEASGASVVVPDEDGGPKWLLTDGGTPSERKAFRDRVNDARKYSEDLSAKITKGRRRWAGKSYQGGKRPYGYQADPAAPEHRKTLVIVEDEAAVLRDAATAILDRGVSLAAKARELREAGQPTVTGTPWTASTLRDVLAKPAVAGLAVYRGEPRPAPWPAIIERDQWDKLRDLFDGRKNPGTGNVPRWLVSLYGTCGWRDKDSDEVCGSKVKCTGGASRRAYTCIAHGHVRRNAEAVDELVTARCIALIERDAANLLRPPPRKGTDAGALRAELRKLAGRKADLARVFALNGDEAALASGLRVIRDRMAAVEAQLAASDTPDPLPEFRGGADPLAVWDSLGMARQRALVRLLYDVAILPAARKGAGFDPDSVRITRKTAK